MSHQRYSQKFRKEWLADPLCKDWSAECPGDATKALCKYCGITICARYASIKQHVTAKKQFAKADPSMLLDSLLFLVKSLFQHIVIPSQTSVLDPFTCDFENFVNQTPYLGYETEQLIHNENFSVTEQETIRKRCLNFSICLFKQIRQRIPTNASVLRKMSCLSVSNALRVVKDPIGNMVKAFNIEPANITNIELQRRNLTITKWTNTSCTIKFWGEVSSCRDAIGDNPYNDLANFALRILCIPHSNA